MIDFHGVQIHGSIQPAWYEGGSVIGYNPRSNITELPTVCASFAADYLAHCRVAYVSPCPIGEFTHMIHLDLTTRVILVKAVSA